MAVPTYNNVDIAAGAGQLHVGNAFRVIISYMGERHHKVGSLDITEHPCHGVGGFDGIDISHSLEIGIGHHSVRVEPYSHEANAVTGHFLYGPGTENAFGRGAGKIVVGGEGSGLYALPVTGEILKTVVKLVVADYLEIIIKSVHGITFGIALEQGEIDGALHSVACIDKDSGRIDGAHAVDKYLASGYASASLVVGHKLAVGIVGMEYYNLVFCQECRGKRECCGNQ